MLWSGELREQIRGAAWDRMVRLLQQTRPWELLAS
jgi:hypothetical protein